MPGGGFASKHKVEKLEQEVQNLRSAMEAQAALFVELREQVAPVDPYIGFMANASASSSPVIRNGRVLDG